MRPVKELWALCLWLRGHQRGRHEQGPSGGGESPGSKMANGPAWLEAGFNMRRDWRAGRKGKKSVAYYSVCVCFSLLIRPRMSWVRRKDGLVRLSPSSAQLRGASAELSQVLGVSCL